SLYFIIADSDTVHRLTIETVATRSAITRSRFVIELASPQDFLPPLPGWRDRSLFIGKQGQISFYHYDFTAQALAKLSRGFNRDIKDVEAMYKQKLFSLNDLRNSFEAITPEIIRFPSLNPDILRSRIEKFIELCENNLEENQS
ncbi:MAG: hypothetical protein ACK513_06065, partial [Aphanizomenon sp.]